MRIRWRGLELPTKVELDDDVSTDTYGMVYIEPFERGFGTTVGNSLRRILLSSLEGSAVTTIKLNGVDHEFSSMPGVMEDLSDIILNIKSLIIRMDDQGSRTMHLRARKVGPVTAGDIETDSSVTIINKDLVIANLTDEIDFSMELNVEKGRGYVPAGEGDEMVTYEHGVIPVDAIFSPVTRVRYNTEETRVGQKINYDRLIMEIWRPEMALVESAKILRKHLGPFVHYFDMGEELAEACDEPEEDTTPDSSVDEEMQQKLELPLSGLNLSVRASNCLEMANIKTIGQLLEMDEGELLALRSFGKTSMREVKRKLADMGILMGAK